LKACSKCKIEKPLSEFSKDGNAKDGKRSNCKACVKQYTKQYRQANRGRILAQMKQYNKANKERISEWNRQYRQANKERISEKKKQWRQDNKEKIKQYEKERRKSDPLFKLGCNARTAIAIKSIPTLKNDAAKAFVQNAEAATTKRATVNFSKQVASTRAILKKSRRVAY